MSQQDKAARFRSLHENGVLVLPNAWDAGSAAVVAHAGAKAVATSSGGVSWGWGRPDAQGLSRAEMLAVVARIAASVEVPVTADVEGGYGTSPEDVAETVRGVVEAGAVGVNLEDSVAGTGGLFSESDAADRLRAARAAASAAGLPDLWINARTDVYLFAIGDPATRFDTVVTRAKSYAAAGADSLFVPGVVDLDVLSALVAAVGIPVNAMAGPGAPSVSELSTTGIRRVSLGTALAQAAYSLTHRAAQEALTGGTYTSLDSTLTYGDLNTLFPSPRS